MRKVLMIARAFPPFLPVGHSIRVVKFIKYLPALGWLPVVLTINDQMEYETLHKVGSNVLLDEIPPTVKIYRTQPGEPSLKFLDKESQFEKQNWLTAIIVKILGGSRRWIFRNLFLPDRFVAWLPFAVWRGQHLIRSEQIDVIFATCPPHSSALVGVCLKLLSRKPLILDFRDDWIDTPWHLSKPKMIRKIERILEKWVVKTADKVTLVTEWSSKAFQHRYSQQPLDKFVFIPNGCDLSEFAIFRPDIERPVNSAFTILHAGSLNISKSWGRNLEGFFKAIQQLLHQPEVREKVSLVFAGDFPPEYRELAKKMGLSGVIKELGHLVPAEVIRLIRSSDLLLAINYDGWSSLIPGKIYEYWAVGGPPILLLSCPGAASTFLEQHSLGISVEPSDVAGIQQAILTIYHQRQAGTPLRVSTAGIEVYDRRVLTSKLAQVLSLVSLAENICES